MVNFGSMNQATADLLKKVSEQKKAEELQKEKDTLQTKIDVIEKNIEKLEDKKVAQTTSNDSTTTPPAPAKSKTLMYVGIVAGGIVVTYLILKFSKKE
jgi:acetyl-CoA carboxylase alpha subunit